MEFSLASGIPATGVKRSTGEDDDQAEEAGAAFRRNNRWNGRGKCGKVGSGQERPRQAGTSSQHTSYTRDAPGNSGSPLQLVLASKAEAPLVSRIWRPGDSSHAAAFERTHRGKEEVQACVGNGVASLRVPLHLQRDQRSDRQNGKAVAQQNPFQAQIAAEAIDDSPAQEGREHEERKPRRGGV